MKPTDFLRKISSDLSLVEYQGNVFVLDRYRLGREEFDYGICSCISSEDILNGKFSTEDVSDIYIDGYFDFLRRDDLPNHYGIPKEVIDRVCNTPYAGWYEGFSKSGYTELDDLKDICEAIWTDRFEGEAITDTGTVSERQNIESYLAMQMPGRGG